MCVRCAEPGEGAFHPADASPAAGPPHSGSATAPPRSQRRAGAARKRGHRETESHRHLETLVCSAVVFMNHAVLIGKPEQAFRMPDEQISLRVQAAMKFFN